MHLAQLKWADLHQVGPFHVRDQVTRLGGVQDLRSDSPEGIVALVLYASGVDDLAQVIPQVSGRSIIVRHTPVVETVKVIDSDWFVTGTQSRETLIQATFPVICSAAYLNEVSRLVAADCTPAHFLDALCRHAEAISGLAATA